MNEHDEAARTIADIYNKGLQFVPNWFSPEHLDPDNPPTREQMIAFKEWFDGTDGPDNLSEMAQQYYADFKRRRRGRS